MTPALECLVCGAPMRRHQSGTQPRACSIECKKELRRRRERANRQTRKQDKKCVICGEPFKPKSSKNTCSEKCQEAQRTARCRARYRKYRSDPLKRRAMNQKVRERMRRLSLDPEFRARHASYQAEYRRRNPQKYLIAVRKAYRKMMASRRDDVNAKRRQYMLSYRKTQKYQASAAAYRQQNSEKYRNYTRQYRRRERLRAALVALAKMEADLNDRYDAT